MQVGQIVALSAHGTKKRDRIDEVEGQRMTKNDKE